MSAMGELVLEIQERVVAGEDNRKIAKDLKVPLDWVREAEVQVGIGEYLPDAPEYDYD